MEKGSGTDQCLFCQNIQPISLMFTLKIHTVISDAIFIVITRFDVETIITTTLTKWCIDQQKHEEDDIVEDILGVFLQPNIADIIMTVSGKNISHYLGGNIQ